MQRRTVPDWVLVVLLVGSLAGIAWLCVTAG